MINCQMFLCFSLEAQNHRSNAQSTFAVASELQRRQTEVLRGDPSLQ